MTSVETLPQKIAIIGAGFTGVALAAVLHRYARQPLEISLYEKTGQFGAGDAYRTPYSWHLLNARACDMSAFEDDHDHFMHWVEVHAAAYFEKGVPHGRQFLPRVLYHQYICSLMARIFQDESGLVKLFLVPDEVVNLEQMDGQVKLTMQDATSECYDQVVLAHGNNPPARLPCTLSAKMNYISNPWDYTALKNIPADDSILIVGTGLSMVDAVMTLNHQHHHGKIYALSRRGLLPLPHSEMSQACAFDALELPNKLLPMMRTIRAEAEKLSQQGGDWRAIICQLRHHLPSLWVRLSPACKKQFLRHVLPYWNIHRHRVHEKIYAELMRMQLYKQLEVLSGRLVTVEDQGADIRLRGTDHVTHLSIKHVINCIGSSNDVNPAEQPLLGNLMQRGDICLDDLCLGLTTTENYALKMSSGQVLPRCYTLGPPLRGEIWETIAVPEIRKQCRGLAKLLLSQRHRVEGGEVLAESEQLSQA